MYGIDLDDADLLAARSWRWLKTRILGLLTVECRLHTKLAPQPKTPAVPTGRARGRGRRR